jgi:ABC-type transport system involved in multi-copper enzyme maturation permease subunit
MLLGPVFEFEMLTTARRGRFYVVRAGYALLILLVLWQLHTAWLSATGGVMTLTQTAAFALTTFYALAGAQIVLILLLTPALTAGVIADERQRKTLHYLLSSRLNGLEIVFGKLMARMVHVAVFLAVGLPVMSMLNLLGGVDYRLVLIAFGVAASTGWLLAAVSVFASTQTKKVREALFVAYVLEAMWLIVPPLLDIWLPSFPPPLYGAIEPINEYIYRTSPVPIIQEVMLVARTGPAALFDRLVTTIRLQSELGLAIVLLAAWRLRPTFRAQEGKARAPLLASLRSKASWRFWRPAVAGTAPMLWKEMHTSRKSLLARAVAVLATILIGGAIAFATYQYAVPAFDELSKHGYVERVLQFRDHSRYLLHYHLVVVIPLLYTAWVLGITGGAAAGITSEREEDTWTSLTTTDLTGREIVFGKIWGVIWSSRVLILAMVALGALGVVAGAIHPAGFLVAFGGMAIFAWFAVSLGTRISLAVNSTWRAQILSIGLMFLLNVSGQAILGVINWQAGTIFPGFTPVQVSRMMVEPGFFNRLASSPWPRLHSLADIDTGPKWTVILSILSVVVYGTLAWQLTRSSLSAFEVAAGRAQRPREKPLSTRAPQSAAISVAETGPAAMA